ncbi:dihydroxyacetone kinase phosphoryl donor subunit DhaM [Liquorilactobacillus vini]|uniref:phosphoenolpyruvate--glycerone phosphotransferase n=1 Tax=Liquorilactobacillus vini DSM 20605 TaxID=1133569 RepID=A0A0R2CDT4_9LACO|nr:dihydroxyacetone kinase phosphoryl donor subunit DhaM [Liquorilactobacillus vini]KRM89509.1 dihydroxyacetone kinase, phosphotransfer subunit [Liquorilactobacillus vini DSM 20605]
MKYGILIVSHVPEIAAGVPRLIQQVAKDVAITSAGGTDENEIGTSLEKIQQAVEQNAGSEILAFYDLGSARMNLEMAAELATKKLRIYDVALIEGAYVAASLLQAQVGLPAIEKQLAPLKIKNQE